MNTTKNNRKMKNIWVHLFFILFSLTFIIPFMYVISISLSDEKALATYGYKLIPKVFSTQAYMYVFSKPEQIIDSYKVTIFTSVVGTILSVLVMALVAYPISRKNYIYKKPITFFIFFTMLFGGGLIPSYILITQYLHMQDNVWVYIVPTLASAWHIIIIRTFFQGLPEELIESAKIDGASEVRVFFQIIVPLSKPVLATIALLTLLGKWNDWMNTMLYIRNMKLFTLQYLLQKILREADFIKSLASTQGVSVNTMSFQLPTESMRFAMVIIAAGPMMVVFPFFQKYFTRGLTIGAVKG